METIWYGNHQHETNIHSWNTLNHNSCLLIVFVYFHDVCNNEYFLFQQKAYNDIVRGAVQSLKDIMLDYVIPHLTIKKRLHQSIKIYSKWLLRFFNQEVKLIHGDHRLPLHSCLSMRWVMVNTVYMVPM